MDPASNTHPSTGWVLPCSADAPSGWSAALLPLGTAAAAAATLSAVRRLGSRCLRRASLSGMAGVTRCTAPVAAVWRVKTASLNPPKHQCRGVAMLVTAYAGHLHMSAHALACR
jgi:hypothetical protein